MQPAASKSTLLIRKTQKTPCQRDNRSWRRTVNCINDCPSDPQPSSTRNAPHDVNGAGPGSNGTNDGAHHDRHGLDGPLNANRMKLALTAGRVDTAASATIDVRELGMRRTGQFEACRYHRVSTHLIFDGEREQLTSLLRLSR